MTDKEVAKVDAATAKEIAAIEEANTEAAVGSALTHEEGLARGYFGTAMSPVPTEVHEAGNEKLRAELYQAAPVVEETATVDGPFASMENARKSLRVSNDLATVPEHPTLRGATVNAAEGSIMEAKKDSK